MILPYLNSLQKARLTVYEVSFAMLYLWLKGTFIILLFFVLLMSLQMNFFRTQTIFIQFLPNWLFRWWWRIIISVWGWFLERWTAIALLSETWCFVSFFVIVRTRKVRLVWLSSEFFWCFVTLSKGIEIFFLMIAHSIIINANMFP